MDSQTDKFVKAAVFGTATLNFIRHFIISLTFGIYPFTDKFVKAAGFYTISLKYIRHFIISLTFGIYPFTDKFVKAAGFYTISLKYIRLNSTKSNPHRSIHSMYHSK